jgi:ABC-2 type transport system permease protein
VSTPATTFWFARHELRLFWREWVSLLTAGRTRRMTGFVIGGLLFLSLLHLLAFSIIAPLTVKGIAPDKQTLVAVGGGLLLALTTMISQAMDAVTKAFYARGDLDLILSSPAPTARVFALRMVAIAVSTTALTLAIGGPFINALVLFDGPRWFAAYGVVLALGALSTALATMLTIFLFRTLGPKLTRTISQIVSAVIGAAFVIGVQVAAIVSIGSYARLAFLTSQPVTDMAPDPASPLWWPARAVMGDPWALALLIGLGCGALALVIRTQAAGFGDYVIAASGLDDTATRRGGGTVRFGRVSIKGALRRKEWLALRRDPWLMSESLMQILYLVPPALLLWLNFAGKVGSVLILVPILVMAGGQLAGGLAWLAVSGEDAPELVGTAPVPASSIVAAKIEAVLAAIGLIFAPLVLGLALAAPEFALVAALGIAVSAFSAVLIQIWFRAQAQRKRFRNRQTSSKFATLAEALSSISWAGTAALAATGTWLAVGAAIMAVLTLAAARAMSPSRSFSTYVTS